ncbi:MAG: response regulator [Burkholderiaceae bacterium]
MADILVVDDEIGIRELLSEILGDEGHAVTLADSANQARQARETSAPDLVLLDIWMPDTDGVTLLKEWAANGKLTMPVIMMSGHATIDTAVEATRIGALDFLEKPITLQKLLKAVEAGLAKRTEATASTSAPAGTAGGTFLPAGGAAAPVAPGAVLETMVPGTVSAAVASNGSVTMQELSLEMPLREARDAFERIYFEHHLVREQGSMTRVAERTGLERTHLYRKLKQLGIDLARGAYRKTNQ